MSDTATSPPIVHSHISGEWVPGEGKDPDINPTHPASPAAWWSSATDQMAADAVGSAAASAPAWRRMSGAQRGDILHRAAILLAERAEPIGADMARELGKTLAESVGETRRAAAVLRYFAGQTLEPNGYTYPAPNPTTTLWSQRVPLGVVAVITPWNFPIAIPAWKIAPALAFGNAVVWKPAELVPLTSSHLLRALVDAGLPAGTLNMVLGDGSRLGPVLVEHPLIDAVTFTGSNAVGQRLRVEASSAGKRVQLELGGKNPAVVLRDADVAHAARTIARAAFMSAGQKCTATSRVIVEEPVLAAFTRILADLADGLRLGDPLDPSVEIGPLASASQRASVERYLAIGRRDGRRVTAREPSPGEEGYFVAPTVLVDLPADSPVVSEEIFGPVAVVLPATSYDNAVGLANDTAFGLAASLFTRDLGRAMRFIDDANVGIVKVNQESAGVELYAPFGGTKQSGYGPQEQGTAAVEFFTHWRTAYIDSVAL